MRIDIKNATVESRQVPGKNGPITFRTQEGFAMLTDGQVWKIRVPVSRDGAPLAVGSYVLADESFQMSTYGDLQLGRDLVFKPLAAAQAPAARSA